MPSGTPGGPVAAGTPGGFLIPGPPGQDGRTILSGPKAPGAGDGVDGDFWIRTDLWLIYGPKAAGAWPAGVLIIGADGPAGLDGRTVLNGTAAPTSQGVAGDFYIRTSTWEIYGPKSGLGTWPGPTSLIGPAGSAGAAGAAGDSGGCLPGVFRRPEFVNTDTYLTAALLASRLYLARFRAPRSGKIKTLRTWNGPNSVLSGRNAKFVVYGAGTDGWPSARLYTSSGFALSNSNSNYTQSSVNVNVAAGDCWAGLTFDGAISANSNLAGLSARFGGITTDPISGGSANVDAIAYDSSYASPADPIGSLTRVNLNGTTCPLVYIEWDIQ